MSLRTIRFVGPTRDTLEDLQKEWLRKFKDKDVQKTIRRLQERMAKDIADLASGTVSMADLRAARAATAADLPDEIVEVATDDSGGALGIRSGITAPNLASLMFVAERWNQNCSSAVTILPSKPPPWLGDDRLHASHRSALLRRDPAHYEPLGWSEPDDLPIFYPAEDGE